MEFLTSTVLSGIAWDQIKKFGQITGEYLKGKLTDYVVNDEICEKIASHINNIDAPYKKNEHFFLGSIEEDKELLNILKTIKPAKNIGQNLIGNSMNGSSVVNGSGNTVIIVGANPTNDTKEGVKLASDLHNKINDEDIITKKKI
ncbi:hypothetical protein WHY64_10735 [Clostridium perfringens]|uniref:hypothetical protein n=1 Tax=Clostridium perfringens TaxID=1502 RepID=UPI0030D3563C